MVRWGLIGAGDTVRKRVAGALKEARDSELVAVTPGRAEPAEPFDPRPGAPRFWLVQRSESGGGPMADFGCHRVEVLLHLLGPVREVRSLVANVVLQREVEDTAVALLRFERGACAVVAVTNAA